MKPFVTGGLGGAMTLIMATSAMAQTAYDDATCRQWAAGGTAHKSVDVIFHYLIQCRGSARHEPDSQ